MMSMDSFCDGEIFIIKILPSDNFWSMSKMLYYISFLDHRWICCVLFQGVVKVDRRNPERSGGVSLQLIRLD